MAGDVADELRAVLELASEEELQTLTEILFRRKFNPLDYVYLPEPIDVQSQDRSTWLDSLEHRFRFLAADGLTVLQGKSEQVSYRQVLFQVCRHMKIAHHQDFSTADLESEIYLHLLQKAWRQLPKAEQAKLTASIQRSLVQSELAESIPLSIRQDPTSLFVKGSGALAINAVLRPLLLSHLAHQVAIHFAAYQLAKEALVTAGAAAARVQAQIMLRTAGQGAAVAAARYGAMRSFLAVLGPSLWVLFFADLGWRTISTNYARIIPAVFALAQIRLARAECLQAAY